MFCKRFPFQGVLRRPVKGRGDVVRFCLGLYRVLRGLRGLEQGHLQELSWCIVSQVKR